MEMKKEESELSVSRAFVARLINLREQLDHKYKGEENRIEQLLTAVDIPEIQSILKLNDKNESS